MTLQIFNSLKSRAAIYKKGVRAGFKKGERRVKSWAVLQASWMKKDYDNDVKKLKVRLDGQRKRMEKAESEYLEAKNHWVREAEKLQAGMHDLNLREQGRSIIAEQIVKMSSLLHSDDIKTEKMKKTIQDHISKSYQILGNGPETPTLQ